MSRVLTPVNIALQVRCNTVTSIIILQVQTKPEEGRIFLHKPCYLHLDLVSQHLGTLQHKHFCSLFMHSKLLPLHGTAALA